MKTSHATLLLLLIALWPLGACADRPADQPAYLQVLTNLREAHWFLERSPSDTIVNKNEMLALTEVDFAIEDALRAASDEGKNLAFTPHEDAMPDRATRLQRALELLQQARAGLNEDVENPQSRAVRTRIITHIDAALRATASALKAG